MTTRAMVLSALVHTLFRSMTSPDSEPGDTREVSLVLKISNLTPILSNQYKRKRPVWQTGCFALRSKGSGPPRRAGEWRAKKAKGPSLLRNGHHVLSGWRCKPRT